MRTALILLLALALASVAGSLIPQLPSSPGRVRQFLADHELLGRFYLRAGLFDVFGSWWFVLIATLLFVSLVACLVPRTRAAVRQVRQRPGQARELDSFPMFRALVVGADVQTAAEASRRVLRRRGFRVAREGSSVAAEKGALREIGSLAFHWAFILLLGGVIVGKGTGYSGFAVLYEGETWIDAQANYDGNVRTGRFFGGDFSGLRLTLVDYRDAFRRSGQPMDFRSTVEVADDEGGSLGTRTIRVNHPFRSGDLRVFQFGFGWAATVEIARGGEPIAGSDPIELDQDPAPEGVSQLAMPWRGTIKLPEFEPQMAVDLELWPDGRALLGRIEDPSAPPRAMLQEFQPIVRYRVWQGTLSDLSTHTLDTRFLEPVPGAGGLLFGDEATDLLEGAVGAPEMWPGDLTVRFADLREYSVLQVTRDRGVPVVLLAAILILVGLLPALYSSRRRLWVRAEPDARGTALKIGGFALQRRERFDEEFERVVADLRGACGAPEPEPVGSR
jgi:cytochrome c biogenesis protein